jgi:hypothetical protein
VDSGEDLALALVWIDVLAGDDVAGAGRARDLFVDARVAHFHDPDQRAGRAFAEVLGVQDFAWDVYLLYEAGAEWEDPAPAPRAWFHQLGEGKADGALRRSGHGLVVSLHEAARAAGFPLPLRPPDAPALDAARKRAAERMRAAPDADDPCAACTAAGPFPSCSLGGWTRLLARNEGGGRLIVSGSEPPSPRAGRRVVRLRLTGLACAECMLRAATGPITLDGVDEVEVTFGTRELRALLSPKSGVDVEDLVRAVRAHGMDAEPWRDGAGQAGDAKTDAR